jgi:hypothetical protein
MNFWPASATLAGIWTSTSFGRNGANYEPEMGYMATHMPLGLLLLFLSSGFFFSFGFFFFHFFFSLLETQTFFVFTHDA